MKRFQDFSTAARYSRASVMNEAKPNYAHPADTRTSRGCFLALCGPLIAAIYLRL